MDELRLIWSTILCCITDQFPTYWFRDGFTGGGGMHPPSPARGSARGRGVLCFIIKQKQILEAIYDTVIWVINCEQQFKFKYSSQARLCSTPELVGHPAHAGSIPVLARYLFARSEKQILTMWLVSEKFRHQMLDQFLLFHCSREQIRLLENGVNWHGITLIKK
jgi:hypothetical protein